MLEVYMYCTCIFPHVYDLSGEWTNDSKNVMMIIEKIND